VQAGDAMRVIADYTLGLVIVLAHLVRMSLDERRALQP
jgi:hypothetical protein